MNVTLASFNDKMFPTTQILPRWVSMERHENTIGRETVIHSSHYFANLLPGYRYLTSRMIKPGVVDSVSTIFKILAVGNHSIYIGT